jgi:hypothetical protein
VVHLHVGLGFSPQTVNQFLGRAWRLVQPVQLLVQALSLAVGVRDEGGHHEGGHILRDTLVEFLVD